MKIKIKDLYPNPYKKLLNKGKLNQEQVKRLRSNIKELKLMGSVPIVKLEGKYHMISHHHRIEALKQEFGDNYEVECTLHDYNKEQMLRGMVIENLTQRAGEFREEIDNLVMIRQMLRDNPEWLISLNIFKDIKHTGEGKKGFQKGAMNISHGIGSPTIEKWLNRNGEVMSHTKINDLLRIHDNLDADLKKEVEKTHKGKEEGRREGGVLNYSQATMLSTIKDKEEQKDLAKVLKNSREQRVRNQGELLTKYKDAPDDVKKKIRQQKTDIANIDGEIWNSYKKDKIKNFLGDKKFQKTISDELDELISLGDKFRDNWRIFDNEKIKYCNEKLKNLFEMKRKAYIKNLGGSIILDVGGNTK